MKKKLSGLSEIVHILEILNPKHSHIQSQWYVEETMKFITPMFMIQWIKDEKLIEYLLSESSHGELIKRCALILKFLG